MESQEEIEISDPVMSLAEFLSQRVGIEDTTQLEARIPTLDIGEREGWTGYIDFIQPGDMSTSLMWGYDKYRRFFLSIRYQAPDGETKVTTVFQRYVGNLETFATGVRGHIPHLFPETYMRDSSWTVLRELITSGTVVRSSGTFTLV